MSSKIATLKILAEQPQEDSKEAQANACDRLAWAYFNGNDVEKDGEEAVKWWTKASQLGHVMAQATLGCCYGEGKGTELDNKKAKYWFGMAARQGNAIAQVNLGICYNEGRGVEKNLKEAKRLFKLAAKQGIAPAHAALAQLEAASGKDADIRKTQKYIHKARKTLAKWGDAEQERFTQLMYKKCKLASMFRCHNQGCSVAYSEDVTVKSPKLKVCVSCRKVAYCSVECQKLDWKARHRKECLQAGADGGDESTAKGGM